MKQNTKFLNQFEEFNQLNSMFPQICLRSDSKINTDCRLMNLITTAFLEEYEPIQTPPDGNCLWHSISISLIGSTELTRILRAGTVYVMLKHEQYFKVSINFLYILFLYNQLLSDLYRFLL